MRLKRKRWIICAAALLLIAAAACIFFGTKYTRQECIIQKDSKRIYGQLYLAGKSLGGSVAALTGSERPEDVAGFILHYPFFVVSEAFLPEGEQAEINSVKYYDRL